MQFHLRVHLAVASEVKNGKDHGDGEDAPAAKRQRLSSPCRVCLGILQVGENFSLIFTARFRRTRGLAVTFFAIAIRPLLSWCHREEEEGEGWCHREEEEGEGERGGPTVRGRGVVPP